MDDLTAEYRLVCDYINYRITKEGRLWIERPPEIDYERPDLVCVVQRNLGDEFELRYDDIFEDLCDRLQITPSNAYATFLGVCQELFHDGVRWGRICALVTFAGSLAAQCHKKQIPQLVGCIADWAASYLETHLSTWIENNGGLAGMCEAFQHRSTVMPGPTIGLFRRFLVNVGVACGAIGVLTIGMILAGRSDL